MKKWRWILIGSGVLVVIALLHRASQHAPTGSDEGIALSGEVTRGIRQGPTLRIGTFNIHGCKGTDGRRDVGRVADCVKDLDFVALSEVHGARTLQTEGQAEQLGRHLGLAWLFAPSVRTWYHLESGNGLLSAVPVGFWQRIPLVRRYDRSYRNAVLASVKHQDRTIHVLLTHICQRHDEERQEQLRAVINLFLALSEPAILLGDLNSEAWDPQLRELLSRPGIEDPVGRVLGEESLARTIPKRIDWIITRGLRCVDAGVRSTEASDHPLIWAELALLP